MPRQETARLQTCVQLNFDDHVDQGEGHIYNGNLELEKARESWGEMRGREGGRASRGGRGGRKCMRASEYYFNLQ